ncbi:hypothetical protein [Mesorhizobium sp. B4-1-4]|uniref:hypothetical protein n=1 Tax=Mesorhizobium sp. B4-1-4 TaxID=2589888 RepID=UPI001127FB5E|nr:hypothetical protein [Mesorhizobium sp. B4-1-4]UCI32190.1 hypothetical protein FJW03_01625 [Mesorhizobium sp. B4-1-4]
MDWIEDQIEWSADSNKVAIGLTRFGAGKSLLLLPALSSISTHTEMRSLQERLGTSFATTAIDWPGFGTLPRPKVEWRPELYRAFLRFVMSVVQPAATIAARLAGLAHRAQLAPDPALAE